MEHFFGSLDRHELETLYWDQWNNRYMYPSHKQLLALTMVSNISAGQTNIHVNPTTNQDTPCVTITSHVLLPTLRIAPQFNSTDLV